jgi:hypothetical protein
MRQEERYTTDGFPTGSARIGVALGLLVQGQLTPVFFSMVVVKCVWGPVATARGSVVLVVLYRFVLEVRVRTGRYRVMVLMFSREALDIDQVRFCVLQKQ